MAKKKKPAAKKPVKAKSSAKPKAAAKAKPAKVAKPAKAAKKVAAKAAAKSAKLTSKLAKKAAVAAGKKQAKIDKAAEKAAKAALKAAEKAAAKAKKEAAQPSTLKGEPRDKAQEKINKKYEGKTPEMVEQELIAEFQQDAEDIVLTDAEGRMYCRAGECDQLALVDNYCRYHYLFFWKRIQVRKKILSEGKLERYVEELTARYPDKFLEMLRKDLRNEKDFLAAIQELELEDTSESGGDYEDDSSNFADEVRGLGSDSPARSEEDY